jgi:hypothetical protein
LDAIQEEAKACLMSQELKTKKSSMELAFNSPENPQTKIRARFLMGGEPAEQINNSLRSMTGNNENSRMILGELKLKFQEKVPKHMSLILTLPFKECTKTAPSLVKVEK